jgi:hypothetical protein
VGDPESVSMGGAGLETLTGSKPSGVIVFI